MRTASPTRRRALTPFVVALAAACGLFAPAAPARAQAGANAGEGKVTLRLKLREGEHYDLVLRMDQTFTQKLGGQEQAIKQTVGLGYSMTVEKVAGDGTATMKVGYDSVLFDQEGGPTGKIHYDSKTDGTDGKNLAPAAKAFSALVGMTFTIKVTPDGRVPEVSGLDDMAKRVMDKMDVPAAARPQAEAAMKGQFGPEKVRKDMENMLAIYPDKPVAIGDSWQRSVEVTSLMPMTIENTYTLRNVENGSAVIDVKSTLATDPKAAGGAGGPVPGMKADLKGEQTGTVRVKESTGWTESGAMDQDVSGTMTIPAGAAGANPVEVPITIKTHMTISPAGEK